MNASEKLQALYDSEINFTISCFWDGGFEIWLGDSMNGYSEKLPADNFEEAVELLWMMAREWYPDATCFELLDSVH